MLHMENGVLHKEKDTMSRMIQTNMGEMPLQDYLDIRALECGFDRKRIIIHQESICVQPIGIPIFMGQVKSYEKCFGLLPHG